MEVRCPHCRAPIDLATETPLSAITCPSCGSSFSLLGTVETAPYETGEAKTISHFELVEQIGSGSFGIVWRARDTDLDRTVAIKIPRKGQLGAAETEFFLREARTAAQVRHPNIVSIHEVGREGDAVFIVSEYVQGVTLAEWLTAKQMSAREAAELCAKLAEAVHHAHEVGVVHRDLKPGNIVLDASGEPHIMDFGLARREATDVTMTLEGRVLGTPAYMSPEQAKGEGHHADRRSDVYSLGVILFELLTGERPFRGTSRMLLQQIIQDAPPSPKKLRGTVPRDLETICLKCLEKDPHKRYASAKELAEDLGRFLAGETILARPIRRVERAWRWSRRNPLVASLLASVVLVLLAGAFVSSYFAILASEKAQAAQGALHTAEHARELAQKSERLTRFRLYSSDMHVADQAWDRNNLRLFEGMLRRHTPAGEPEDLRSFEWYYLWRLWDRDTRLRRIPMAYGVRRFALCPKRNLLAAAHVCGSYVTLWDLADSTLPKSLKQFGEVERDAWVETFVALSPDGDTLAHPSANLSELLLEDWGAGSNRALKVDRNVRFTGVAFSPTGELLATAHDDARVRLWDLASGRPVARLEGHSKPVSVIAFSRDGERLASGGEDGALWIWNAKTREGRTPGARHTGRIQALAWSVDGNVLASGGVDREVRIWDATSGELLRSVTGCRDEVRGLAFSPDGTKLAAGDRDGVARFWETSAFQEIEGVKGYTSFDLTFDPGGSLWFADRGGVCAVPLEAQSQAKSEVLKCDTSVPHLAFAEDSGRLALVAVPRSGKVCIWRLEDRQWSRQPDLTTGVTFKPGVNDPFAAAVSGHILAVGGPDGDRVVLFNLWNHRQEGEPLIATSPGIWALAFSGDGRRLAAGCGKRQVVVWGFDKDKPTIAFRRDAHEKSVRVVALNRDGTKLVTGSWDGTVKLWDMAGEDNRRFPGGWDDMEKVYAISFSPNDREIAVAASDIGVWDVSSGKLKGTLRGHKYEVPGVAFFKDGATLVSAGADRVVKIWDVRSDVPIQGERFSLEGHTSIFTSVAVSPDEKWIAAGARDGTIRLYRAATEEEVRNSSW